MDTPDQTTPPNTQKQPAESAEKKTYIKPVVEEFDLDAFAKHDACTDQSVREAIEAAL